MAKMRGEGRLYNNYEPINTYSLFNTNILINRKEVDSNTTLRSLRINLFNYISLNRRTILPHPLLLPHAQQSTSAGYHLEQARNLRTLL